MTTSTIHHSIQFANGSGWKRLSRLMGSAAAAMVLATAISAPVLADNAAPGAPSTQPVRKAPLQGGITDEGLGEALQNLGYEPEVSGPSGAKSYSLKLDTSDFTFVFRVSISSSMRYVWISSTLGTLTPAQQSQAPQILKLLKLNDEIGPSHFSCDADGRIAINVAITNELFTNKKLRDALDGLMSNIRSTEPFWNTRRWPASGPTTLPSQP